jgi:ketosteroid isomerase-like protein
MEMIRTKTLMQGDERQVARPRAPENGATFVRTAVSSRSSSRRCIIALAGLLLGFPSTSFGQVSPEAEVKAVVEHFLMAAGRQDLDALPAMFAPGASIASAHLRQGRWVTASQSFDAWLATLRAAPRVAPYQEPVNEFTVHIADGQLAFVRADAYVIREGRRRSHNIDYFTLIRDAKGEWKFVNGSYTTKPVQTQ